MEGHLASERLIRVARGDEPADLILSDACVVNVFTGSVEEVNIAIAGGRIAGLGEYSDAREVISVGHVFVTPGLIDAHMHVESTMMPPSEFARLALPHGTTTVVLDPHEIANVLGIEGIRFLMDNARGVPMNCLFAASSCVPSSHLETAGAELSAADLEPLFDDERVVALAEMMNFPGVINALPGVLEKVNLGLERRIVDGHCPGLRGKALEAYIGAGISSDHESVAIEEAREKLSRGMHIYIREGSAARNLEALLPLVNGWTRPHISFCTDDRHPGDLRDEGHIDHIIRKAVKMGLDPITCVIIATLNTAHHYRQPMIGAVAPGRQADLIVADDLEDFRARMVFHRGELVARDGEYLRERRPVERRGAAARNSVRLPEHLSEEDFVVPIDGDPAERIRVIGMDPHQLVTEHITIEPRIEDGRYAPDAQRDILTLVVVERHNATGNIGRGFVKGFGFSGGALGSTVGHDSHNLAVVGDNPRDMYVAALTLEECGGGQCVVANGEVQALLPLPIAGLMSDKSAEEVIEQQQALLDAAHDLGCPHHDPFMPLSFLPLPVIPSLKLSDLGLVDVEKFEVVPLEA